MLRMIICLMGPTASGKTDIALELANKLPCDIISVDSAMVYRGMDIGTAKPTPQVRRSIPHHLIDIRELADTYSVAAFHRDAVAAIKATRSAGRIPLLVGGTLLYFNALQYGLSLLPAQDKTVRQRISEEARVLGWPALHQRLLKIDPTLASKIQPQDTQRIQRALEVYKLTKQPMSKFWQASKKAAFPRSEYFNIVLAPKDRSILHRDIEHRFRDMLNKGFVEEVKYFYDQKRLSPQHNSALRAVGYREIWGYLEGQYTYTDMQARAVASTRQLAKRQFTWLRGRWPEGEHCLWFDKQSAEVLCRITRLIQHVLP